VNLKEYKESTEESKMKDLIKQIHDNAKEKGFYDKPVSVKTRLALINTELNEAIESDRTGYNCKGLNKKGLENSKDFINEFELYWKDRLEDEICDAKIRILDFVGSLNADDFIKEYNKQNRLSFELTNTCEMLFEITGTIYFAGYVYDGIISLHYLSLALYEIEQLAKYLGIDLDWHIEMKMRYNETRERLHGKSY